MGLRNNSFDHWKERINEVLNYFPNEDWNEVKILLEVLDGDYKLAIQLVSILGARNGLLQKAVGNPGPSYNF